MTSTRAFLSLIPLAAVLASPALADHEHEHGAAAPVRIAPPPRAPMAHPAPAPAPPPGRGTPRAPTPGAIPAPPPAATPHGPHMYERPHVDSGQNWRGHDTGPGDHRYHVERPWSAGRFRGPIGHEHAYHIRRWDPRGHRFWLNGAYFGVAPWDLAYASDWTWDGDEIVLYDDPDHPGWYLAYNTRTGNYVHVEYGGEGELP